MSEDIVVQLRGWSEGSSDDSRRMVWLMRQSADTIEALRGEVDLIRTLGVGAALETVAQKERAQKAEAEAARLKGALEALAEQRDRFVERFNEARLALQAAEAERDRLAGEVARIRAALDIEHDDLNPVTMAETWVNKARFLDGEVVRLTAERDRLKAVLKPRLNAKAIEGLQEILEAMEAMDEREAPFLKTLLDWHEASRKALGDAS